MSGSSSDQFAQLSSDDKLNKMWEKLCQVDDQSKEMILNINTLKSEIGKIDARVEKCEYRNNDLAEEVKSLKITVNDLQQAALDNDVIIRNVDEIEKNEDDLLTVTQLILDKINIPVPVNILNVRRLGRMTEGSKRNRSILVTLGSAAERDRVMAAKRKVAIKGSQIVFENMAVGKDDTFIFFDENLTKHTADLYYAARQLRKRQQLKFVWVRRGKLYAKKRDGDQPTRITDLLKINELAKRKFNSTPNTTEASLMEVSENTEVDTFDAKTIIANDPKKRRPQSEVGGQRDGGGSAGK